MSRYLKKKVNCPDMEPTWSTWDFPSKANLQRIVCQRTGTWDGQTIINHLHAKPWHPSSSVLVFLGIFSGIFMDLLGCPCEGQRPLRLDPRSRGKCHKPRLPHKGIIRERQFDMKFWWIRMPKLFCEDLTRFLKQIEWHWYELVWNASRIARARSVPARVLGPSCCRCWGSLALQHLQQSCWKTRFNSPNAQGPSHLQLSASTWPRHRGGCSAGEPSAPSAPTQHKRCNGTIICDVDHILKIVKVASFSLDSVDFSTMHLEKSKSLFQYRESCESVRPLGYDLPTAGRWLAARWLPQDVPLPAAAAALKLQTSPS